MAEQLPTGGGHVLPAGAAPAQPAGTPDGLGGVLPSGATQTPGYVPPPTAHAQPAAASGIDPAELAAFRAFQEAQKTAPKPAPLAPTKAVPSNPVAQLNLVTANVESDPILSSYVGILNATIADFDQSRAFGNALAYNDPNLIDVNYINEVAGEGAPRALAMAKGLVEHVARETEAVIGQVHAAAGGEPGWNAATAAFNKDAPDHLKAAVGALLDSGKKQSILAGCKMVADFAKATGRMPQPGELVNAGGAQPAAGMGLSKTAFQAERLKLDPNDRDYRTKVGELMGRRAIGKANGQ